MPRRTRRPNPVAVLMPAILGVLGALVLGGLYLVTVGPL